MGALSCTQHCTASCGFVFGIQPTVLQLHTQLNGILNSLIIIPSLYYAWKDWLWWMVVQTMCSVNALVWVSLFVLLLYALWSCLMVTIMEVNMIVALYITKRWCLSQMLYYAANRLGFYYSSKHWNIEYLSYECNLQNTKVFSWGVFDFLGGFGMDVKQVLRHSFSRKVFLGKENR